MNKKTPYFIIAAILAAAAFLMLLAGRGQPQPVYGVNLLKNADFEKVTDELLPEAWLPDAYERLPGTSLFEMTEGRSGQGILVNNIEYNDARFMQTVAVAPNTLYELSAFIKADAGEGKGANVSVADVFIDWQSLQNTENGWKQIKNYGRTGPAQKELTVYARLGGYSAESLGTAAFDDLALVALKEAPEGVTVERWETWDGNHAGAQAASADEKAAAPAWPWLLIIALVWTMAAYALAKRAEREEARELARVEKGYVPQLIALLAAAILTRLAIAVLVPGYGVDIGCFTAWSDRMYHVGPAEFYLTDQHSDYPPGYMLVLWLIGLTGNLLGTGTTELMVKLPAIFADALAVVLLFRFAAQSVKRRAALCLAALYAFNPLLYASGAAWGQVDSLHTALIVVVVILVLGGRWKVALPLYTLSVLMKPQALMFGPLGLAALVLWLLKQDRRGKWKDVLIGAAASLLVAAVVIVPFSLKQKDADWLIKLYSGTMNYYSYATVNATNLYFLFGLNWQPTENAAPFLLRLVGAASLTAPVAVYWLNERKQIGKRELILISCSLLPAFASVILPVSLGLTGTLLMISGFLLVLVRFIMEGSLDNLPLLGAVMLTVFCVFGAMMHERYLFPAIALLMLAYIRRRDRQILLLMVVLSVLTFLNVGIALDRGVRIGGVPGHLAAPSFGIVSDSEWLEYLLSAGEVLAGALAVYVGLVQSRLRLPVRKLPAIWERGSASGREERRRKLILNRILHPEKTQRLDAKDWLLMLGVTLVYAALALSNLGATKAPQKPWISTAEENTAVFDLGSVRRFNVLYYPGIEQRSESEIEVSVSSDGERWLSYPAQVDDGTCFQWVYVRESVRGGSTLDLEGRYLKIYAPNRLTTIMEILAREAGTDNPIRLSLISGRGEALIDEQDTLDGDPSWYNSAYFDEIYHARTGYEHANAIRGLEPNNTYETSHPPLGKVLIALSTMIFGMTPFGWRFPGALTGVLMLPAMYMAAKLLTKKRFFAFAAAALLALDGMHFAQTRIATIDSFATLFILWSYYFMFRYAVDRNTGHRFKSDLVNLGLSGLFMGFAIASKWTGFYAGAGLAVIFFWSLSRRVQEGMMAGQLAEGQEEREKQPQIRRVAEEWPRRLLLTLGWCILFFILVPAFIYYISFLPWFMRTPGGLTVQKVWDASVSMFKYHSVKGFGMDHPYYSPWYEWPLILKPFYFYAGKRIGDTGSTIMSFGNPAVWWGGFAAMLILIGLYVRRSVRPDDDREDHGPLLLIIGYMAQYAPWMLVPRGTYLYHYFPSVPFIALAAALVLYYLYARSRRFGLIAAGVYLLLALALFIGFFPYYSGIRVSAAWLNAMRWFPRIYY